MCCIFNRGAHVGFIKTCGSSRFGWSLQTRIDVTLSQLPAAYVDYKVTGTGTVVEEVFTSFTRSTVQYHTIKMAINLAFPSVIIVGVVVAKKTGSFVFVK